MNIEDVMSELRTKLVIPAWPHVAILLDVSKNGLYDALDRGDIPEAFKVGRHWKVRTTPLRKRLGMDEAA